MNKRCRILLPPWNMKSQTHGGVFSPASGQPRFHQLSLLTSFSPAERVLVVSQVGVCREPCVFTAYQWLCGEAGGRCCTCVLWLRVCVCVWDGFCLHKSLEEQCIYNEVLLVLQTAVTRQNNDAADRQVNNVMCTNYWICCQMWISTIGSFF